MVHGTTVGVSVSLTSALVGAAGGGQWTATVSLVNAVCTSLSLASIILSTGEEAMARMEVNSVK